MQPLTLPVKLQPSWLTCRNQSVLKPASVMTVTALSFGMASWRRSRKRHCTSLFCASSAGTTSLIRGSERPLQSRLARRRCQFLSCQPVQSTAITQKGITEVMACVSGAEYGEYHAGERYCPGTVNPFNFIFDVRPAGQGSSRAGQGQSGAVGEGNSHGNKDINPKAVNVR